MSDAPTRPSRSERRADRYRYLADRAMDLAAGRGFFRWMYAWDLWTMRSRAARRLRFGPKQLRGKGVMGLFRLLYQMDGQ